MSSPAATTTPATEPKEQAFVLKAPKDFWWTVRIPVPTDDDYQLVNFKCLFLWLDQTKIDRMRGIGLEQGQEAPTDHVIAKTVLKGWQHLDDGEGGSVPFSEEARDQVLASPMVRSSIVATYLAVMTGVAARKNGSTPR